MEITGRAKSRFQGIIRGEYEHTVISYATNGPKLANRLSSDNDASLWSDFDVEYYMSADIPLSDDSKLAIEKGHFCYSEHLFNAIEDYEERRTGKPYVMRRPREELMEDPTALVAERTAYRKWEMARTPIIPEPIAFTEIDYAPETSIRETYKQDGLQVIVKMASIELTPEKPEFPAGGWHVCGVFPLLPLAFFLSLSFFSTFRFEYFTLFKSSDISIARGHDE